MLPPLCPLSAIKGAPRWRKGAQHTHTRATAPAPSPSAPAPWPTHSSSSPPNRRRLEPPRADRRPPVATPRRPLPPHRRNRPGTPQIDRAIPFFPADGEAPSSRLPPSPTSSFTDASIHATRVSSPSDWTSSPPSSRRSSPCRRSSCWGRRRSPSFPSLRRPLGHGAARSGLPVDRRVERDP